jgi:DNA topoisomerase-3
MKVIITEKPSVAKDIAAHLGITARHEGYFEGKGCQITWAFGHLISLKDPHDYNPLLKRWSLATLPIIPQTFELKVVEDKGILKQFSIIKKLFNEASELICATDAGREGELIFRYILTMCECTRKPWRRLWLSSLTNEALATAFKNLKPGSDYDNLYAAARCRSEADWIVGLNATRNLTVRFGTGKQLWSVGRVQTPVLAMIVARDHQIHHFKAEPFFELYTKYREVVFKYKGERFKTQQEADAILQNLLEQSFLIEKVSKKKEVEHPPLLYDLTELQREINRKAGMAAADTLQIAQTLYEQKLITYPRTDSRYLTQDMKPQVIKTLENLKKFKESLITPLDLSSLNFSNRIIQDKKVTDHHAIIPTGKFPSNLSAPAHMVYETILIRLIAAFYPACHKELTTIEGISNQIAFQAKGTRVVSAGWTALYPKKSEESKKDQETQELPLFVKGEVGAHTPYTKEGKTTPPSHFNESTLLGAMETAGKMVEDENLKEALKDKGIGTPATRASIIETLIKRGYIARSGKTLQATDLGYYLIALLQDTNLKSPELTGEWESKLKLIERGKFSAEEFMQMIAEFTKQIIDHSDIYKINTNIIGPCPCCKNAVIKGNKGYGCSKWKEGCTFVLWTKYKNSLLSHQQVCQLLQKKVLIQTKNQTILCLLDSGELKEISIKIDSLEKPAPNKKMGH